MGRVETTNLGHTAFERGVFEMMKLVKDEEALEGFVTHDELLVEGSRIARPFVRHHQSFQRLRIIDVAIELGKGKQRLRLLA